MKREQPRINRTGAMIGLCMFFLLWAVIVSYMLISGVKPGCTQSEEHQQVMNELTGLSEKIDGLYELSEIMLCE